MIFLLFFCIFSSISGARQPDGINVMTYNIRYANPQDGPNAWDHRRALVKSTIQFHEADLIGVQEALRKQLDDIMTDMPEYAWYGVCRTDGSLDPNPDNEFSAILYRKDRFERLDGSTFWLSEHPDSIGSKGWDAALPRIVTWCKFRDKQNDRIFYHFNTHFDHMGQKARAESAKLLLEKINTIAGNAPVVLTGDFNCTKIEAPYQILTDISSRSHLTDAASVSEVPHHGPEGSFAGNFQISGLDPLRIDFIFVKNNIRVRRSAVLSDNWNGRMASDHLAVFAEIMLR